MPTGAIAHFVFVDFENVQTVDLSAIDGAAVRVTLLLGKNQRKLELALVHQIQRLAADVQLIEVGATGRNALDLTLAYHLGLAARHSPQARFHIVSKDKDFDPLIAHLRANQMNVERHEAFASLPFLPAPKKSAVAKKVPDDRRAKVIARLKNPLTHNRPSSRKALLAHIKTGLGKEGSDAAAEEILAMLTKENVLTIESKDKVLYIA